ncbi:MAG: NAD(P)-binding domain-containing protein [Rhodoplanes sp.]|uniref:NADPH-dependent F420 reductase n=1 Tax=Rhodoplanes sp. TaxID=1968906 RepID=UPI0018286422|nr:NAD(P)-binding domain-containing protein [Rhodoplanes sp.]NVO16388.1 NAD(P)-binding domain-containing protein [Rhodoplanes sp.]
MKIAILGAGNVGGALGAAWARAGHMIAYGVSEPGKPAHAAVAAAAGGARVGTVADAVRDADAIVLAVPWGAVPAAIAACGDLAGRIVLDATNPLTFENGALSLSLGFDTSGGEQVTALSKGAHVFKTLNQVGYEVMADASGFPTPPTMFVAGPDGAAKQTVLRLVADLGFAALDAGPIAISRLLEPHAMLWIHMAMAKGAPRDGAFALMRKTGAAG